jgi:YhcH/YjgK/YiaL family protein
MILDRLDNWALYFDAESRMGRAFRFLTREFDPRMPDQRFAIEGDDIYAIVQTNPGKPDAQARLEAHRLYADIQLVLSGSEGMGWAPLIDLEIETPYDEEKDIAFYKTDCIRTRLEVYENHFAVFYPNDAHAPCLHLKPGQVTKKVVVKVKVG